MFLATLFTPGSFAFRIFMLYVLLQASNIVLYFTAHHFVPIYPKSLALAIASVRFYVDIFALYIILIGDLSIAHYLLFSTYSRQTVVGCASTEVKRPSYLLAITAHKTHTVSKLEDRFTSSCFRLKMNLKLLRNQILHRSKQKSGLSFQMTRVAFP